MNKYELRLTCIYKYLIHTSVGIVIFTYITKRQNWVFVCMLGIICNTNLKNSFTNRKPHNIHCVQFVLQNLKNASSVFCLQTSLGASTPFALAGIIHRLQYEYTHQPFVRRC